MSEPKETKRTKSIAFRLTDEEYAQAERAAMATGDEPNNWCREVALMQSSEGHDLTRNELGKSDARRRLNSAMQRAGFPIPR